LTLIAERELTNLSDTSKDYMKRTIRSAEQMQQLIIDLLAYSRTTGSEEHFKKTDLNDILRQVRNELKETIEAKNASIQIDNLPALNIIPFQIRQLFTNLLSNSLKFTRPGVQPHIVIKYEIVDGAAIETIKVNTAKKYFSFAIIDNGIGFEKKYNEKVFGLFQRLNSRNTYSGTGIGLSICKKIVDNHGGIITAHGEPDKGATFTIYLPG
jgi:signal transduction histidine kinase